MYILKEPINNATTVVLSCIKEHVEVYHDTAKDKNETPEKKADAMKDSENFILKIFYSIIFLIGWPLIIVFYLIKKQK